MNGYVLRISYILFVTYIKMKMLNKLNIYYSFNNLPFIAIRVIEVKQETKEKNRH